MAGKPQPKKVYKKIQEGSGRPSKFTPDRRKAIVDDIGMGLPYLFAAEGNGISEATLYVWLNLGKEHIDQRIESEYTIFIEDIKRAETNRVRRHVSKIDDNIERWQADAWLLERRWYKHFGANVAVNELNERLAKLEKDDADARKLHSEETEEAPVAERK